MGYVLIMSKISICCPVYTMKGKTAEKFLVEYFSHLIYQTFKDFDIVISDQSEGDNLRVICDTFSHVLDIKYFKNTSSKKNAANKNTGKKDFRHTKKPASRGAKVADNKRTDSKRVESRGKGRSGSRRND